jgi:hypothetical protein
LRIFPALISIILTPLVTLTPVLAQSPETAPSLELRVLESSAPDHLAVAVTDAAGQRVSDATVVLRLPTGAFFSNASESATAQTDANGVAEFQGIQWGPGGTVRLTASKGSAHAGLLIEKPPVSNAPAATQPVAAPPVAPEPAARHLFRLRNQSDRRNPVLWSKMTTRRMPTCPFAPRSRKPKAALPRKCPSSAMENRPPITICATAFSWARPSRRAPEQRFF